jgi:hypothetical protein
MRTTLELDDDVLETDVYLLGLAVAMGGRLATLDQRIPLGAVVGATRETLTVIGPADRE